jgi:CRISPR/Cas system-associated protein Cas5 (RAMP superfamily)
MHIFVETTIAGKTITIQGIVIKAENTVPDKSRDIVLNQVKELLTTKNQELVDQSIPGRWGKGEGYMFVFEYSILDRYNLEENKWEEPKATLQLLRIGAKDKAPLIKPVN